MWLARVGSAPAQRIEAWCIKHSQNRDELPFILSQTAINFRDIETIKQLKTIHEQVDDISLIVIDTLNRNSGSMNEKCTSRYERIYKRLL